MSSQPSPNIQQVQDEATQDLPPPHSSQASDVNPDRGNSEIPTQNEEISLTLGRKRKFTSQVWEHFTLEEIDGTTKAVCKYCSKKLGGKSSSGTKHLHDHAKICLMRKHHEARSSCQKKLIVEKTGEGKSQLVSKEFKQDVSRKELVNFIVLHEQPLSIVDDIGFRRFVASLQPQFMMVSQNTIKSDIMKIFEYERSKMMKLLASNKSRVGITTDMWTSQNQRRGFMVITTHWIDSSWKMQSRIIRFAYVPCPHTSETLCEVLIECFLDWNLDMKLSTLTVDNCTTNDAIINLVLDKIECGNLILRGDHFHMRCCAHILTLIVKDGMDVMGPSIEKIRDSVAFWRATPKREERFREACRQLGIAYSKTLLLDCKTRWNSTYLMLETALLYRDVFPRLKQRESSYTCFPKFDEWELDKDMCQRLQLFHSLTALFSGSKYPTTNLYFPKVMEIKWTLSRWIEDPNDVIKLMAKKMVAKFDKYWLVIHGMMGVVGILDPRFKKKIFDVYKGDDTERIKKIYFSVFAKYEKKYSNGMSNIGDYGTIPSSSSCVQSSTSGFANIVRFDDIFTQCLQPESLANSLKSELELYFDESLHPMMGDFDILGWWKTNKTKYPIVSKMARDILAIPLTTVASESAFSTSGRIMDPYRSRLSPSTLEALMCSKSWIWSELVNEGQSVDSFYRALTNDVGEKDDENE